MKCNNCGFEHQEATNFCPQCGNHFTSTAISLNPMADRISSILTSGMFLSICILLSASSVVSLFCDSGIPVFPILFTIFLWLCFAQGKRGFVDQTHIRSLSGTIFAYYIVEYVAAGSLILGALLTVTNASVLYEIFLEAAQAEGLIPPNFTPDIASLLGVIILVILIVASVGILLINIFGIRKIHLFIQSVYRSIEYNQNQIVYAKAARTWLIVLGGLSIVGATLSLLGVSSTLAETAITNVKIASPANTLSILIAEISPACTGLSGIFAGILIDKHLINTDY